MIASGNYFYANELPLVVGNSDVLRKATEDNWTFLVALSSGLVFSCTSVQAIGGDWLHLCDAEPVGELGDVEFVWGRGVDVRASEIAWTADCDS